MANSNAMARADAAKSHIGGKMLVLDSAGDVGQVPFQGRVVAWVNFDGTAGTITPRASENVSSISDGGTGTYTVNFATAMPDANYGVLITVGNLNGTQFRMACAQGNTRTVNGIGLNTVNNSMNVADESDVTVVILR